jgi:hypothetical protein
MATTPLIMIFVRHSAGYKYEGNELARRFDCRKWLRWTQDGTRHRLKANTRSWAEAEQVKRDIEDQLTGKPVASKTQNDAKNLRAAIEVFVADKRVQGVPQDVVAKYERELGRLATYCEGRGGLHRTGCDARAFDQIRIDVGGPLSVNTDKVRGADSLPGFPQVLLRGAVAPPRPRLT